MMGLSLSFWTLLAFPTTATAPWVPTTVPPEAFVPVVVDVQIAAPALTARPAIDVPAPAIRTVTPKPSGGTTSSTKMVGTASWGPFGGNIVTREKRGTPVKVCGELGCTKWMPSYGYGPVKNTGRIVDLDVNLFEDVCGPRSIGLCKVTLYVGT